MKKVKLVLMFLMLLAPSSFLIADCIGNTTHACTVTERTTIAIGLPGGGGLIIEIGSSTTWCCTAVGNGSDFSCTDGQSWQLSSALGCTTPQ